MNNVIETPRLSKEDSIRKDQAEDDRAYTKAWSDMKNDVTDGFALGRSIPLESLPIQSIIYKPVRLCPQFPDITLSAQELIISMIHLYGQVAVQNDGQWVAEKTGIIIDVLALYQMGILVKTSAPGQPDIPAYTLGLDGINLAATMAFIGMMDEWDGTTAAVLVRMHHLLLWSLKNLNGTYATESRPDCYDEYVWLTPSGNHVSKVALDSAAACYLYSEDEDDDKQLKLNRRGRWLCDLLAPVFKRMEG